MAKVIVLRDVVITCETPEINAAGIRLWAEFSLKTLGCRTAEGLT